MTRRTVRPVTNARRVAGQKTEKPNSHRTMQDLIKPALAAFVGALAALYVAKKFLGL